MDCVVSGAAAALSGLGGAAGGGGGGAADAALGPLGGLGEAGAPQGVRGAAGAGRPDVPGRGRNPYRLGSGAEVDNVGESGEESEDEWNYYRVEPTGDKESAPQNPDSGDIDDMESQLNPNAAVFIPSPPGNSNHIEQPFNENLTQEEFFNKNDVMSSSFIAHDPVSDNHLSPMDVNGKDEEWLSSSPKKGGVPLDNVHVPPEDEFDREVSQRPSDLDVENQLNVMNGEAIVIESLQNGQKILEDELFSVKDQTQNVVEASNPFTAPESPQQSSDLLAEFSLSCKENQPGLDNINEPVEEPILEKLIEEPVVPTAEPVKAVEDITAEIEESALHESTKFQGLEAAVPFDLQPAVQLETISGVSKDEFAEDIVAVGDSELLNDTEQSNGNFEPMDHSPIVSGATDIARDHINDCKAFLEPPSFAQGLSSNDTSAEQLNDGILYSNSGFDNMMDAPSVDLNPVSPSEDQISAQSTPFEGGRFEFETGDQDMPEDFSAVQLDKPVESNAVFHQTEAQVHSQFEQESNLVGEFRDSLNLNKGFAEDSEFLTLDKDNTESQIPCFSENQEIMADFLHSEAVALPTVSEEPPVTSVPETESELAVVNEEPFETSSLHETESPAVVEEPFGTSSLHETESPVVVEEPFETSSLHETESPAMVEKPFETSASFEASSQPVRLGDELPETPALLELEDQVTMDNEPLDGPVESEMVSDPVTFVQEQSEAPSVPDVEKPVLDQVPSAPEFSDIQAEQLDDFVHQSPVPVSDFDIQDVAEESNPPQEKVDLVDESLAPVQLLVSVENGAVEPDLVASVSPVPVDEVVEKEIFNGLADENSPIEPAVETAETKLPEVEAKVEAEKEMEVEHPVSESATVPEEDSPSQVATVAAVGAAATVAATGVAAVAAAVAASKTDKKPASKAPPTKARASPATTAKAPVKTTAKTAAAGPATAAKRTVVPPVPAARAAPKTSTTAAPKPKPSEAVGKPASAPKPAPPKPRTTLPASKPTTTDRKPLANGDASKPAAAKPLARAAPARPATAPARTTAKPAASAAAAKPSTVSSTTAARPPPIRKMPPSTTAPKPKPAPAATEVKPKPPTTTSAAARPRPATASSVSSARSTVPSARAAPASKPIDKQTKETTNKLISATRSTVSRTTTASKTTLTKSTPSAAGTTAAAKSIMSKVAPIKKPPTANGTAKTAVGKKPSEKPKAPMTNGNVNGNIKNGHTSPEPVQNGISHEPVIEKKESDLKIESLVDNHLVA